MRKLIVGLAVLGTALGVRATTYRVVSSVAEKTGEWANALTSLNAAVAAANASGDEILVKSGTYALESTLALQANNVTFRSDNGAGQIDREHTIVQGNGSFRLLSTNGRAAPTIQGFTFRGGADKEGAGLYMAKGAGAYRILDCTVENCTATGFDTLKGKDGWGAAIYSVDNDGGTVSRCILRNNSCVKAKAGMAGAAFYGSANDRTTISGCVVTNNAAEGADPAGGGICASGACRVIDTFFADNTCVKATNARGGHLMSGPESVVTGCTFADGGRADSGASFAAEGTVYMTNCTFTGSVTAEANGLVSLSSAAHDIVGCRFSGITFPGGLIFVGGGDGVCIRNTQFTGNDIQSVVRNHMTNRFTMENCTIADNTWQESAKPFYCSKFATNVLVNCIIAGGTVASNAKETFYMTNCCVEIASTDGRSSGEIVTARPEFVPVDGNYLLKASSPCVDAGMALGWTGAGSDLAGRPRTVGAAVDIGCFERQTADPACVAVRVVRTEEEKAGVWSEAFVNDIQGALDAVGDYGVVYVKPGVYSVTGAIRFGHDAQTLASDDGTGKPAPQTTVLDGAALTAGPVFVSDVGMKPLIGGLTVRNAQAGEESGGAVQFDGAGGYQLKGCVFRGNTAVKKGGAIWCRDCPGAVIRDCLFADNRVTESTAGSGGGAICIDPSTQQSGAAISLVGCSFSNNVARGNAPYGGAVAASSKIVVDGGVFVGNCTELSVKSKSRGGVVYTSQPSEFRNVTFSGHANATAGSVVFGPAAIKMSRCSLEDISDDTPTCLGLLHPGSGSLVENCTVRKITGGPLLYLENTLGAIVRNSLMADGNAYLIAGNNAAGTIVENCTFAGNSVPVCANTSGSSANVFVNSILLGTVPSFSESHTAVLSNCFVSTQWDVPSTDVIVGEDPGLQADDYDLKRRSVCRDKGLKLDWMTVDSIDLAGLPRLVNRRGVANAADALPDIGCYEFQGGTPGLSLIIR